MTEKIYMNDVTAYDFIGLKKVKPIFRAEYLEGVRIRHPKKKSDDRIIKIQDIKWIQVIGRESGHSLGGGAIGAAVGGVALGGAGALLGGALGAGKNVIPAYLHLKNGDKFFVSIKTKQIGALEALLHILGNDPSQEKITVQCEWCAEPILINAKLCKHCQKEVSESRMKENLEMTQTQKKEEYSHPEVAAPESISNSDAKKVIYVIAIICVVFILYMCSQ